jgi:low temperature requirement protein LtrA
MDRATEAVNIASLSGTLLALGFFLALCLGITYVIYTLLTRPESRRAEFVRLGAVGGRTALAIAGCLGLAVFLLICSSLLSGFHRIEPAGDSLHLQYLFPPRTVVIRRDEIRILERKYAYKLLWRVVVTTTRGQRYESRAASAPAIDEARLRLAQLAAE